MDESAADLHWMRQALGHAAEAGRRGEVPVGAVVVRGVQRGIERTMQILMPVMAALLVALAVYSMRNGDAGETLRFLFVPDFDELSGRGVLDALGLGFFSIGVGLGILITYASYSPPDAELRSVAIWSVRLRPVSRRMILAMRS